MISSKDEHSAAANEPSRDNEATARECPLLTPAAPRASTRSATSSSAARCATSSGGSRGSKSAC